MCLPRLFVQNYRRTLIIFLCSIFEELSFTCAQISFICAQLSFVQTYLLNSAGLQGAPVCLHLWVSSEQLKNKARQHRQKPVRLGEKTPEEPTDPRRFFKNAGQPVLL
jgi:hypothetical protein